MKKIAIALLSHLFVFSTISMDHSTIKKWALESTLVNIQCGRESIPVAIDTQSTIEDLKKKIWCMSSLLVAQQELVAYYRNPKTMWLSHRYSDNLPNLANVKQVMSTFNTDTLVLLFRY